MNLEHHREEAVLVELALKRAAVRIDKQPAKFVAAHALDARGSLGLGRYYQPRDFEVIAGRRLGDFHLPVVADVRIGGNREQSVSIEEGLDLTLEDIQRACCGHNQERRRLFKKDADYEAFERTLAEAHERVPLRILGYVERNPLRSRTVKRAEAWRWGSLWRRTSGDPDVRSLISDGPLKLPGNWASQVNRVETEAELAALRVSLQRGRPFGDSKWQERMSHDLDLGHTFRPRGRPFKESDGKQ